MLKTSWCNTSKDCNCANVTVGTRNFPYLKNKCVEQRCDFVNGCEPDRKMHIDRQTRQITYSYVPCHNPYQCDAAKK